MARLGIISDVHGDVHALRDALDRMSSMGCGLILCAGDLVDYGLFPDETIELLRHEHVQVIRGNHDRWALSPSALASATLSKRSQAFLRGLPRSWSDTIEGVRVAMHHASPGSDMLSIEPDASPEELAEWLGEARADVLIVGHSHLRLSMTSPRGLVINPGALLRDPGDGFEGSGVPAPGTFGVLDLPARRFTVFRARDGHEVEFDARR